MGRWKEDWKIDVAFMNGVSDVYHYWLVKDVLMPIRFSVCANNFGFV
jgi:hypothetical protein